MLVFGGLISCALALVLIGSYYGITLAADEILGRQFAAQTRVFDRIRVLRLDEMQHGADLLSADFGFRSAVASGDAPTITSALASLKTRMGIDEALLVTADGQITGFTEAGGHADLPRIKRAIDEGATRGVLRLGGLNFRAVASPVNAPDPVGWVVFLARLDDREMAQLSQLSAIPLRARIRPIDQIERDVPIVAAGSAVSVERQVDGDRLLVQASRVESFGQGTPQALVLEFSLTRALGGYAGLFEMLFASCALALALALAGAFFFARRLARPIVTLGQAAERVSRGDYAPVAVGSDDEVGRLAASFNRMIGDIADRERRLAQTEIAARARLERQIGEVQAENRRLDGIASQHRAAAMAEAATALEQGLAPLMGAFEAEADRLSVAARDMRASLDEARRCASEAGRSAQRTERLTQAMAGSASELATSGEQIAAEAGATLEIGRAHV